MPFKYATPLDRLLANTRISRTLFYGGTPCMLWTGSVIYNRNGKPYGRIGVRYQRGPRKGRGHTELVHRWVVKKIKRRSLSRRQPVRHLCNQTLCGNPYHVGGGTQRSNVRQAVREGRHKTPWRRTGGERYAAARAT